MAEGVNSSGGGMAEAGARSVTSVIAAVGEGRYAPARGVASDLAFSGILRNERELTPPSSWESFIAWGSAISPRGDSRSSRSTRTLISKRNAHACARRHYGR
jgi:hypothetical protein